MAQGPYNNAHLRFTKSNYEQVVNTLTKEGFYDQLNQGQNNYAHLRFTISPYEQQIINSPKMGCSRRTLSSAWNGICNGRLILFNLIFSPEMHFLHFHVSQCSQSIHDHPNPNKFIRVLLLLYIYQ